MSTSKISEGCWGRTLRDKNNEQIEARRGRRKIDISAYWDTKPIAFIETESDLDDLRDVEVTRRNGHYDVFSIAKSASGAYFHSYKSLEHLLNMPRDDG